MGALEVGKAMIVCELKTMRGTNSTSDSFVGGNDSVMVEEVGVSEKSEDEPVIVSELIVRERIIGGNFRS